MKNTHLELGNDVPLRLVEALPPINGLKITRGRPPAFLTTAKGRREVVVIPAVGRQNPETLVRIAQGIRKARSLPVITGAFLSRAARNRLEHERISYLDGGGTIHLVGDGIFVHVEGGVVHENQVAEGVGIVGVRVVQTLLLRADAAWSVADLAHDANASAGQAHKVLRLLENEDLVVPHGRGPGKRRRIRDPGMLLNWLADQRVGVRRGTRKTFSLYARSPAELARRVGERLARVPLDYAITGAAAAELLAAGPTAVPQTLVRIDPKVPLDDAAEAIDAEPADRGANLALRRDVGHLGTTGAFDHEGLKLASRTRIYLDLLTEKRGEDLANHFRETVLGF